MKLWGLLGFVATFALIGAVLADDKKDAMKEASGIHDFTLKDSEGNSHNLMEYKTKKKVRFVVLEWTHPTCPYVVPHYKTSRMQKLAKKYMDKGVAWLTINSNRGATAEAMETWRKENKIPQPVLIDPTGSVGRSYDAKVTPHMYVLDLETGKRIYEGAIDDNPRGRTEKPTNYVAQTLDAAMAGKAVPTAKTKPYG